MEKISGEISSRKKDVCWNTVAVSADALQSTVILSVIAYKLGIEDAGIFSIGYALANLASAIARYGVRNYQVTDRIAGDIFPDYFGARVLTVSGSLTGITGYLAFCRIFLGYGGYKTEALFLICVYKLIDALEDVCVGYYQQQGRLFVGVRITAARLISSTGVMCAVLLAGANLVTALGISVVYSSLLDIILFGSRFHRKRNFFASLRGINVRRILRDCTALAVSTSMSMYVGNIPKYMIDWYMTEDVQAIFGYLMMPAFCIVLLSRFVYQPMVRDLGILWQKREKKKLKKAMQIQCVVILCITALAIPGGIWVGIPVLNLLYHVELRPYRIEFAVLFLGGSLFALASFLAVLLTVTGRRKEMAAVYITVSLCSFWAGRYLLEQYGIAGAAVLYLILNLMIALCFLAVLRKDLYEEK